HRCGQVLVMPLNRPRSSRGSNQRAFALGHQKGLTMHAYRFFSALALVAGSAVAAGCSSGGHMVPSGASNAVPASARVGWLSAQANHGSQLYVADQPNQRIAIFSQNTGQPTGQITDAIA